MPAMPRVNLANPQARAYMLQALAGWVRDYGVDGWRLDVARYVDPDVWRDLRRALREIRADTYLLAEVMGDAGAWLQGDAFDASMNYPLRELALRFLATGAIDGREVLDGLARLSARHAWPVMQAAHNLVGSHDTPRCRPGTAGSTRSPWRDGTPRSTWPPRTEGRRSASRRSTWWYSPPRAGGGPAAAGAVPGGALPRRGDTPPRCCPRRGSRTAGVRRVRDVEPAAAQWRTGGGSSSVNRTRILDAAWPEAGVQEKMLSAYPAATGSIDGLTPDDFGRVPLRVAD